MPDAPPLRTAVFRLWVVAAIGNLVGAFVLGRFLATMGRTIIGKYLPAFFLVALPFSFASNHLRTTRTTDDRKQP